MNSPKQAKVRFVLNPDSWHGHGSESLWAEQLEADRFRLLNTPFFVKGVSYGDVVRAISNPDGEAEFQDVVSRSGYSTCRIVRRPKHKAAQGFGLGIEELEALGCEYESGDIGDTEVIALNIPPETDIGQVYEGLDRGEKSGIWDWETGFDGHPPDAE